MIDVHSHIVFGVDDGSRTIEQTMEILAEAYEAGFEKVIATPHYIEGYYENDIVEIHKRINLIKQELKKYNNPIQIMQGNEIYITENITELLESEKATSLNQEKYVLFELPLNAEILNIDSTIYQLMEVGAVPVLAHPERYPFVQKDPNKLIPIIEKGVIIQSNYGSIIGQYGREAKNAIKQMLEHRMVHLLGSDVHRPRTIYPKIPEAIDEIRKIIGIDELEQLTAINPKKVINGENLDISTPIPIKNNFFTNFFN